MATTNDQPPPTWRDFAAWSAVGAIGYILVACGGISLLREEGLGEVLRSKPTLAMLGLGLIFSTAVVGFSNAKRRVSPRTLRNFVIRDAMAVTLFLLFAWGFSTLGRAGALDAMGGSEWAAAGTGSALVILGLLGVLIMASARAGTDLVDDEMAADEMRERGRLFLYSFAWMAVCGLLLIGLGLAGPDGVLPPGPALAGALVLVAVLTVLGGAVWRLSDELGRTLSYEAGNLTFYLILAVGGGWAMLAHLGFAAAPAPLDWLTMVVVLMLVASFIAVKRRNLTS